MGWFEQTVDDYHRHEDALTAAEFCPHNRHINVPCGDCTVDKYGENYVFGEPPRKGHE
jgi:hypothetical protein